MSTFDFFALSILILLVVIWCVSSTTTPQNLAAEETHTVNEEVVEEMPRLHYDDRINDTLVEFRRIMLERDRLPFNVTKMRDIMDKIIQHYETSDWLNDSTALGNLCDKLSDYVLPYWRYCEETKTNELRVECAHLSRRFVHGFVEKMKGRHTSVPPWGTNWYHFSVSASYVLAQVVLSRDAEIELRDLARQEIMRMINDPFHSLGRKRTMRQAFQMTIPWLVAKWEGVTMDDNLNKLCEYTRHLSKHLQCIIRGVYDETNDLLARDGFECSRYYAVVYSSAFLHVVCADAVDLTRDVEWASIVHPSTVVAKFPDMLFALGSESFSRLAVERGASSALTGCWTNQHVWRVFSQNGKFLLRMPGDVTKNLAPVDLFGEVRDARCKSIRDWRVRRCDTTTAEFEYFVVDARGERLAWSRYAYVYADMKIRVSHEVRAFVNKYIAASYLGSGVTHTLANGETYAFSELITL